VISRKIAIIKVGRDVEHGFNGYERQQVSISYKMSVIKTWKGS